MQTDMRELAHPQSDEATNGLYRHLCFVEMVAMRAKSADVYANLAQIYLNQDEWGKSRLLLNRFLNMSQEITTDRGASIMRDALRKLNDY